MSPSAIETTLPTKLAPDATYFVTFESSDKAMVHTGAKLAEGVELVVTGTPDAELASYHCAR